MATVGVHYVKDWVKEQLAIVNYTAEQITFALGRAVERITIDSARNARKAVGCICASCLTSHHR